MTSASTTPRRASGSGRSAIRFHRGRHYVPAWGLSVEAPDGARLAYTGDTGPSRSMAEFARGADLLLVEATLRDVADDDPNRGHLTPEEAIELATAAEVRSTLLVHYPPDRRRELEAMCAAAGPSIRPAVAGTHPDDLGREAGDDQPSRQVIVRTGWAAAWAARTLMCAATAWAMAVIARPAGPGSRWATAGTPTSPPWRTVMSSGMPPR